VSAGRAFVPVRDDAFFAAQPRGFEAATLVDDVASQRVLEKSGFTRIALARNLRLAGAWRDHLLFRRTVEE